MNNLSGISVVLPSLDPDEKLSTVIDGLLDVGFTDIILVNDGSRPENLHYFSQAELHPEVHLLHHAVNRGKGAALKTAFSWFLENRPDGLGVVTVDGDNQHHPDDTRACALEMARTGHVILGVRDFSLPQVPRRSRMGNRITSAVLRIFYGMHLRDTQTGLRAIPTGALRTLCQVGGDRFEYETNMLLSLKDHAIAYGELPIRTVYIEENRSSHFHAIRDSWRIYKLIFSRFFRYLLASLGCAVLDDALFALLSGLLHPVLDGLLLTAIPTFAARAVSSLTNFFLNQRLVFRSRGNTGKALLRYYLLVIPVLLLQTGSCYAIFTLFRIPESRTGLRALIYAIVMVVFFLVNHVLQQRWVFAAKSTESDKEVSLHET